MPTMRDLPYLISALSIVTILALAQQQTGTRRIPQFENDDVRVWKSIITPRQPLSMHRHDHPRAIIALAGGSFWLLNSDF